MNRRREKGDVQYTDEDLLEALRDHKHLTCEEWETRKINPSVTTISKRFGGWNKARQKAGVPIFSRGGFDSKKVSELIDELNALAGWTPLFGVEHIDELCNQLRVELGIKKAEKEDSEEPKMGPESVEEAEKEVEIIRKIRKSRETEDSE